MQTMTTDTIPTRRPRRIDAIARSIIRDLRRQDDARAHTWPLTAVEHVRAWRDEAGKAGDNLVVYAVDVLGEDEAAKAYEANRGTARTTGEECERLARAWRRRHGA